MLILTVIPLYQPNSHYVFSVTWHFYSISFTEEWKAASQVKILYFLTQCSVLQRRAVRFPSPYLIREETIWIFSSSSMPQKNTGQPDHISTVQDWKAAAKRQSDLRNSEILLAGDSEPWAKRSIYALKKPWNISILLIQCWQMKGWSNTETMVQRAQAAAHMKCRWLHPFQLVMLKKPDGRNLNEEIVGIHVVVTDWLHILELVGACFPCNSEFRLFILDVEKNVGLLFFLLQ